MNKEEYIEQMKMARRKAIWVIDESEGKVDELEDSDRLYNLIGYCERVRVMYHGEQIGTLEMDWDHEVHMEFSVMESYAPELDPGDEDESEERRINRDSWPFMLYGLMTVAIDRSHGDSDEYEYEMTIVLNTRTGAVRISTELLD